MSSTFTPTGDGSDHLQHSLRKRRGGDPLADVLRPPGRAQSHFRFVPPLIHFIPDSLIYSVPLFLKRQCDRTLPPGPEVPGRAPRSTDEQAQADPDSACLWAGEAGPDLPVLGAARLDGGPQRWVAAGGNHHAGNAGAGACPGLEPYQFYLLNRNRTRYLCHL